MARRHNQITLTSTYDRAAHAPAWLIRSPVSQSPSQSSTHRMRAPQPRALSCASAPQDTRQDGSTSTSWPAAFKTKKIVHEPRHVDYLPKRRNRLRPCLSERRVAYIHRIRYLNRSTAARRHGDGVRARRLCHRNGNVGDRGQLSGPSTVPWPVPCSCGEGLAVKKELATGQIRGPTGNANG